jgi:hypothetical protein
MNDATNWALGQSQYKGAVQTVLMAISRHARGCRAECSPEEIRRFLRMGKSSYAWAVSQLEKIGDLERLVIRLGRLNATAYHLQGFCHSAENIGKSCNWTVGLCVDSGKLISPTATKTSGQYSDPISHGTVENSASGKLQRSFLFPDILTKEQAREVCEECRGTSWRTVKYRNSDGDEAEGVMPCKHEIVRLAGRWSFKPEVTQERFLDEQIGKSLKEMAKPGPRRVEAATQLSLRMLA